MKYKNRYEKLLFLQRFIEKYVDKLKKAAPRFELGIKDLQSSALPLGHAAVRALSNPQQYPNSIKSNSLLIISNGHGEDVVASLIIKQLILLRQFNNIEVMPLVGDGQIFDNLKSLKVSKIGFQKVLPSGGFSNQSLKGFWNDLKEGMLIYLFKNWLELIKKPKDYKILAIGDLLPLFYAWTSKCEFGFIGTPKSDYTWMSGPGKSISDIYHKLKGSEWDPWELYLMKSHLCKFVIVRDEITSKNLNNHKVDAQFLGNPMMDFFQEKKIEKNIKDNYRKVILLIGSRFPEAYKNLDIFLAYLSDFYFPKKCLIFVPLSSNANIFEVEKQIIKHQFFRKDTSSFLFGEESVWFKNKMTLLLGKNKFNTWAYLAELGLANAGTATEQICGLGIPALSVPGKGPQFTKSFAMRQQRLLGGSVSLCDSKRIFHEKLLYLLENKQFRVSQGQIGKERMGTPGASKRIADIITSKLNS